MKIKPRSLRLQAFNEAESRARAAGLDEDTADAVAHRVMTLWDPEFTKREWHNFIDQEISRHAAP